MLGYFPLYNNTALSHDSIIHYSAYGRYVLDYVIISVGFSIFRKSIRGARPIFLTATLVVCTSGLLGTNLSSFCCCHLSSLVYSHSNELTSYENDGCTTRSTFSIPHRLLLLNILSAQELHRAKGTVNLITCGVCFSLLSVLPKLRLWVSPQCIEFSLRVRLSLMIIPDHIARR